jgi:hypothetical protein
MHLQNVKGKSGEGNLRSVLWISTQSPSETFTKLWYDGANVIAQDSGSEYNLRQSSL